MELARVTQPNVAPCHLRHARRSYYHCWPSSYLGSCVLPPGGVWWIEVAKKLVTSRERFLLASKAPIDPTEAAMNGLLLTPLLGCTASHSLDWCHAWALLGAWANFMVFPLPPKDETMDAVCNGQGMVTQGN